MPNRAGPLATTVQFKYWNGKLNIYDAGDVNYALYGSAFNLCHNYLTSNGPWSQASGESKIRTYKTLIADRKNIPGAIAFFRYGYLGMSPESAALKGFTLDPNNVTRPVDFLGFRWNPIARRTSSSAPRSLGGSFMQSESRSERWWTTSADRVLVVAISLVGLGLLHALLFEAGNSPSRGLQL